MWGWLGRVRSWLAGDTVDDRHRLFSAVLAEEINAIYGDAATALPGAPRWPVVPAGPTERAQVDAVYGAIHALNRAAEEAGRKDLRLSALCLSGGGIRSASFALGILQGLAKQDLLSRFHYLSTVSGGGYVGAWLSAWIRHAPGGLAQVADELKRSALGQFRPAAAGGLDQVEAPPVRGLRAYTTYLTPQAGPASPDTWAPLMIFLRNMLLNWFILVPVAFAVVALPLLLYRLGPLICPGTGDECGAGVASKIPDLAGYAWALALILLFVATTAALANRPSWKLAQWNQGRVFLVVAIPFVVASFLLALLVKDDSINLAMFALMLAIFFLSWVVVRAFWLARKVNEFLQGNFSFKELGQNFSVKDLFSRWVSGGLFDLGPLLRNEFGDLIAWCISGVVFGFGPLLLYYVVRSNFWGEPVSADYQILIFFALGMPAILFWRSLSEMIFIGLVGRMTPLDDDREWFGRLAGLLSAISVMWIAWIGLTVGIPALGIDITGALSFLQHLFAEDPKKAATSGASSGNMDLIKTAITALGGIGGIVSALLGASSFTKGPRASPVEPKIGKIPVKAALFLAIILFLLALDILLANAADGMLNALKDGDPLHLKGIWAEARLEYIVYGASIVVLPIVLSLVASYFINVNRFSLHGVYRNRLIRAFLGPTNVARKPNPFTGFDENDNIPMHTLWPDAPSKSGGKLYHIINTTVNSVATPNTAWQERKADSFSMTPRFVGNARLGYRPSRFYAGWAGITLGTAMTISGAAANPNQGYNSSPITALLMTLFNVRLGAWLGNPRSRSRSRRDGPKLAFIPILREALLLTREDSPILYLSDGGHFENLGIYEAIRRRCGLIVVSDAGCDPLMQFVDLGNAIRKVRIDFGVRIDFARGKPGILPRGPKETGSASRTASASVYWAIANIHYPEPGAPVGRLIYIKPAYYGDEPPDIRNFAETNQAFPHDSTLNQWFSESQFESYRHLGEYVAGLALADWAVAREF